MSMNPERKKLWTDALRSGRFKQGSGYLSREGKHCCLGVACVVAIENGLDVAVTTGDLEETYYDSIGYVLPAAVADWYGLDSFGAPENPLVVVEGHLSNLAAFNDGTLPYGTIKPVRLSFPQIADVIDEQL